MLVGVYGHDNVYFGTTGVIIDRQTSRFLSRRGNFGFSGAGKP
jgi:hypothetical protein